MLLRSITKHVKDQNWFAVFIDFIIVVFKVRVAFTRQLNSQVIHLHESRRAVDIIIQH